MLILKCENNSNNNIIEKARTLGEFINQCRIIECSYMIKS